MTETQGIPADQLAAVKKIDGWLSDREVRLLWSCARDADGPIVEIGSHEGKSTAALALGSMAGGNQAVYAIDSFVGTNPEDRPTDQGRQPGWKSSSPERLRANLDAAGVNGLVKVLPFDSQAAAEQVPNDVAVLFVDGTHTYEQASADLETYLPRLGDGGLAVLHDFHEPDPGVIAAATDHLISQPDRWQILRRCDTCLVARKRPTATKSVMLAVPGDKLCWNASRAIAQATLGGHTVDVQNSGHGWDDMNELWVRGLNAAQAGAITHFAMLHTDIAAHAGWLDCLLAELDEHNADLVSAVVPIKDARGLTSCGIGDSRDPWSAHRRFTMRELATLPDTFGSKEIRNGDTGLWALESQPPTFFLLHNTGCWAADLRSDEWYRTEGVHNSLVASFQFRIRARKLLSGKLLHERESEDWYFSRRIAELGLKTLVTRKVELSHVGDASHPNFYPWGAWEHDEETRPRWDPAVPRRMPA